MLNNKKDVLSVCSTPFYLFDLDVFRDRLRTLHAALGPKVLICYAMKANPFLVGNDAGLADAVEACSAGEIAICARAGLDPARIIMSGINKTHEEIASSMHDLPGLLYTVESPQQFLDIEDCARANGVIANVLLRLSSDNQFGMDQETIRAIVAERSRHPAVAIAGLQYFSGTQKKSATKVPRELAMLDAFCAELESVQGFTVGRLEYGPGLPVKYFTDDETDEADRLSSLAHELKALRFQGTLALELGRFIAASCGTYVTRVADVKTTNGVRYAIVDGGIHQLNYFGQLLAMRTPSVEQRDSDGHVKAGETQDWTVCGSLCTMNDVLLKAHPFHDLARGDLLVFGMAGAYSMTEGIALFLSRPLPLVALQSREEGIRVIRDHVATATWNHENRKEA